MRLDNVETDGAGGFLVRLKKGEHGWALSKTADDFDRLQRELLSAGAASMAAAGASAEEIKKQMKNRLSRVRRKKDSKQRT